LAKFVTLRLFGITDSIFCKHLDNSNALRPQGLVNNAVNIGFRNSIDALTKDS